MPQRILFFLALLFTTLEVGWESAQADELYTQYRGARVMAMGGSALAIPDLLNDETSLFYNPAGLAGATGPTFHLINITFDLNADMIWNFARYFQLVSGFSPTMINDLVGQRLYLRGQGMVGFTTRYFGIAFFYDQQTAFITDNPYLPQITLGYQWTYGLQAGVGVPIFKWNKKQGELRAGIGGKMLWRRGKYDAIPFSQVFNIGLTTLDDFAGGWSGPAFGFDLGLQYVHKLKRGFSLHAGGAYTNIADTVFSSTQAARITSDLGFGVALGFQQKVIRVVVSAEYRNILQDTDWRKRTHAGLMIGLPIVSFYGGLNQGYLTYGASLDLWLFKITGLSYAEERGATLYQIPERRYMLQVSTKLAF